MRPHHTKDKGDVGVAHAIADLANQGFVVLTALCEHAPFDLVAYRDGTFARVQVKYRTLASNGAIKVNFVSSWSDSRGTYHRPSRNGQALNVLVADDYRSVPAAVGVRQVRTVPGVPTVS